MTGRVLIADGDPALRQRISAALIEAEVFVDAAASARDALTRLMSDSYNVVTLDVALPGDVDLVLGRIAAMPERARPVVLALAASAEAARSPSRRAMWRQTAAWASPLAGSFHSSSKHAFTLGSR
jgi:CheY-like chemotaxis protein